MDGWEKDRRSGEIRESLLLHIIITFIAYMTDVHTLMYSMGHTAVASIPPAMHPAVMAKYGFFFCVEVIVYECIAWFGCGCNKKENVVIYPLSSSLVVFFVITRQQRHRRRRRFGEGGRFFDDVD